MFLVDEMDSFLEKCRLSKSTLLEAEHLNRPITIEELEKIIKELFHKGQDDLTGEFYQILKFWQPSVTATTYDHRKRDKTFTFLFEVCMTLILEYDRFCPKKKATDHVQEYYCKHLKNILVNKNPRIQMRKIMIF